MFHRRFHNSSKLLIVIGLSLVLSACGFYLRGNIPLSDDVKSMFVNAPQGTFKDELERVLVNAGAELTENKSAANVELRVAKVDVDRTVGTLDERGKASSYNLVLKVRYVLKDSEGKNVRKAKTLRESRQYNFDPELVIESEAEERELLDSMEQDVALRIVRQLASITEVE